MRWLFTLGFPLLAILLPPVYGPLSLALVFLAAWRFGLFGASLAGCWAGLWGSAASGVLLPQMALPPLVVGCLAGYVIERQPVLSSTGRLLLGLGLSALALLFQLALSGYSPAVIAQTALLCWWSWALWSAGVFWLGSFLFPAREW